MPAPFPVVRLPVGEVEGVGVDELERVVAAGVDGGDGEDEGLDPEVGADEGVRGVGVRRPGRGGVGDRVPGALVLGAVLVLEYAYWMR